MNLIKCLVIVAGALPLLFCCFVTEAQEKSSASTNECLVYVGTYTRGDSKGIYAYRMNLTSGVLTPIGLVAETPNPAFMDFDSHGKFLFAANEIEEFKGKPAGAVTAYAIDRQTGKLTLLNQVSTGGKSPCAILIDRDGKNALVANYTGGSLVVLPIEPDGKLKEASTFIQLEGKGPIADRQEAAHAHCMTLDSANRFVFVCDLGSDKIMSYLYDPAPGKLITNKPPFTAIKSGAGPRHLAFHPNGRFAYLINELNSSMTAFAYNPLHGIFRELQTLPLLPPDFTGQSTAAELAVHPSGKFLYGSNRGHDSITVFAIDPTLGTMTFVDRVSSGGKIPRYFAIDPTGKFLIAANQDSNNLVVFIIDAMTGKLKPTGQQIETPTPVCVKFLLSSTK